MTAPVVDLAQVAHFLNGGTPSRSNPEFFRGDIPWITGADINEGKVTAPRSFITEEAIRRSATNRVPAGTVLLVTRTGVGKVARSDFDLCFSQDITAVCHDETRVDPSYLVHYLRTQKPRFERSARGATIRGVTREAVSKLPLPLPPLPEQRRIAAMLDKAEELIAKRRAALALLDQLPDAMFLEMFGDPAVNPMRWPLALLGEVAAVQGGLQVTSARLTLALTAPYLRVANVLRGRLDLAQIKTIQATPAELGRTALAAGDLLVVEGHGNKEEIGRAAMWDGSIEPCTHQNHLIRVRFLKDSCNPIFACHLLNSPGGRRALLRAGKTTSGLNTITVSDVKRTPILLPPISVQNCFATRIVAVDSAKVAHESGLTALNKFFASLQAQSFANCRLVALPDPCA